FDTTARMKRRFRAAARKAAIAAGAPHRVNLLDWWISKLARGRRLPFIQGLIQLSIEYCEELESNSLELKPLVQAASATPGLRRDRYGWDPPVPYWLYVDPHQPLPNAADEFAHWNQHIWQCFESAVAEVAREPRKRRRWVDGDGNHHLVANDE